MQGFVSDPKQKKVSLRTVAEGDPDNTLKKRRLDRF